MRVRALLLTIPLAVGAAACGSDQEPVVTDQSATTATTEPSGDVPDRIVSISPTSTEVLFAVGAGDQVVAVDDQSTFPADAPTTDLSGYEPNVEAIASYEPDLVVTSSGDPAVVDALEALDIEVLVHEAAVEIEDVFDQIVELGDITGHGSEARALTSEMRNDLTAVKEASVGRPALTAYWELDPTYYSVTSNTFIGKLLGFVNVTSIADEAQAEANDYPQLSAEFVVEADPDLILLADTKCCQQSHETVAARPGWGTLTAVTNGNVVELDDDIASRWGPRIVELLQEISEAAEQAAA
jgi:iron complex transport system substrate-binding protein